MHSLYAKRVNNDERMKAEKHQKPSEENKRLRSSDVVTHTHVCVPSSLWLSWFLSTAPFEGETIALFVFIQYVVRPAVCPNVKRTWLSVLEGFTLVSRCLSQHPVRWLQPPTCDGVGQATRCQRWLQDTIHKSTKWKSDVLPEREFSVSFVILT